ncbi:MAG: acyl-CoA dehydrogenase family protein [Anaerolineae bacterium]
MNFRLTDEQAAIGDTVRKYAANECPRETARELDAQAAFPGKLLKGLADLGFCELNVPPAWGGAGENLLGAALVVEELAAVAPALAMAYAGSALRGGRTLSQWGSQEQQARLLPAVSRGESVLTYALAESAVDAEPETAKTRATPNNGGFLLNGEKKHVALAQEAEWMITAARTGDGLSLFLVPTRAPGVVQSAIPQLGARGVSLCHVRFENVHVPAEDLLGGVNGLNQGAGQWAGIRALEQIEAGALGVGIAQGAYDYAVQYAQARVQFGQPLTAFEAVAHMLVEISVELRAARLLLHEACWLADEHEPFAVQAAIAGMSGVQVARKAAFQCLHILGGYGYMMEYDAQRYVRDALALLGGSESVLVWKNAIAEGLGLNVRESAQGAQ